MSGGEVIRCGKHVPDTSSNRCLLPRGHDVHDDDPQQPEPVTWVDLVREARAIALRARDEKLIDWSDAPALVSAVLALTEQPPEVMDPHSSPHFSDVDGKPWCMCCCQDCALPPMEGRDACVCPECHCHDVVWLT